MENTPQSLNKYFYQPQKDYASDNPVFRANPPQNLLPITQQTNMENQSRMNANENHGTVIRKITVPVSALSSSPLAQSIDTKVVLRRQRNTAAEVQDARGKYPGYSLRNIESDGIWIQRHESNPNCTPAVYFIRTPSYLAWYCGRVAMETLDG